MESIQQEIIKQVTESLTNQLENYIIEGLKLKGFEFNNKLELENFIKQRCRRIDNVQLKEHIYLVDDIPFFLHRYEVVHEPITEYNNGIKMTANYGYYSYL